VALGARPAPAGEIMINIGLGMKKLMREKNKGNKKRGANGVTGNG